ncbi:amidohydrolase [Microbacterium sp. NPDC077663]|uniref:amidohydrolase n=1 Tax=Microbacterium sp. NPDC077663 TaxID=3364189 RepID=UPI0037C569A0
MSTTDLGELYRDLHRHPELSLQEFRTAAVVADRLRATLARVHVGVGGTGVVAVFENGPGPVVWLRADMDGLPVREQTGLDYASTRVATDADGAEVPVMHACGHDIHTTCLIGAVERLAERHADWGGTLVAIFQPAEEYGAGAQAMLDDDALARMPHPDVVLGQHLVPLPAGTVSVRSGVAMSEADAATITMHGVGGHGSMPAATVDPVFMAATTVVRLHGIVSREVDPRDRVVVTVGKLSAGTRNNIIPDDATIGLTVRTESPDVRERVRGAVERIVHAEAEASGAPRPPEIAWTVNFPLTENDAAAAARVRAAFSARLGAEQVLDAGPLNGSEDVSRFSRAAGSPLVYWFLGGFDPALFGDAPQLTRTPQGVPTNHSPLFAPIPEPTIETGVTALVCAAEAWLGRRSG